MTGRAILHSEFEAILYDLSEAQALADRRRVNEPISKAEAAKVLSAKKRLDYIVKILIAAGLLVLGVLFLTHVHESVNQSTPFVVQQ